MFVSPLYCNLSQIRFGLINLSAEIPWYYNGDNNRFVGNNKNGCGKRVPAGLRFLQREQRWRADILPDLDSPL